MSDSERSPSNVCRMFTVTFTSTTRFVSETAIVLVPPVGSLSGIATGVSVLV